MVMVLAMAGGIGAGVANEECAACHDQIGEAFAETAHGIYLSGTGGTEHSCESCHGPGETHTQEGDPEQILNPADHDQFAGRETCLECHNGHTFDDWDFSGHRNADVTCASCHQVHVPAGQLSKKAMPDLCYDCHSDVRAATYMPSHHPIAEGKLGCQDCHNVHGGSVTFAMGDDARELCFTCHAEKEGPFLYEHAPVNENCMLCHAPHGAVADNLLTQAEPTLCLNCHAMHFHATVEGVEGPFGTPTPQESGRTGISTADGFKRAMLTKCTQCHTQIHGSDLPSQARSTGGNALTR
jgi:DmsE family decaheme c-type cytochrome